MAVIWQFKLWDSAQKPAIGLLAAWIKLYPHTLILQPNPEFKDHYDTSLKYENGQSRKDLTGSNPHSGADKSWVVGLKHQGKTICLRKPVRCGAKAHP